MRRSVAIGVSLSPLRSESVRRLTTGPLTFESSLCVRVSMEVGRCSLIFELVRRLTGRRLRREMATSWQAPMCTTIGDQSVW